MTEHSFLTEQMNEVITNWLEWKGYKSIQDYCKRALNKDVEDTMTIRDEYGEDILINELTNFTMTSASFLDFYYNTGDDQSQNQMREDIGYEVVNALLEGREFKLPTAEGLFEDCGFNRMHYCVEVVEGHPLEDFEDIALDWDVNINLI
jgi:hypothetical protein